MAYLIERFGATWETAELLPTAGGEQPLGSDGSLSGRVQVAGGGAYDAWGDEQAPAVAGSIEVRGIWQAVSESAMETKIAALKALRGTRSRLWRSNGVSTQWRYARLMAVEDPGGRGTPTTDEISLEFQLQDGPWYGTAHDDTTPLDSSPKTITLTNGGNVRVTNPILTIKAGSAPITALTVEVSGVSKWTYSGTIAEGKSVVIDCGSRSVENDGTGDYEHFALDATGHLVADWLQLQPGSNSIKVTLTGGATDSTFRVQFSDGWA